MKKHDYSAARSLTIITSVVFFSQLIIEILGVVERRAGYENVVLYCGIAFLLSIIYSTVLIYLNARIKKRK